MNDFNDFVHKHSEIANYIPFISAIIKQEPTPLLTKLLETGIMAALAFGASLYVSVPIIQKEISTLHNEVEKLDRKIERLDEKVERIKTDIYKPYIDQRLK